jgi:hypothetical protein
VVTGLWRAVAALLCLATVPTVALRPDTALHLKTPAQTPQPGRQPNGVQRSAAQNAATCAVEIDWDAVSHAFGLQKHHLGGVGDVHAQKNPVRRINQSADGTAGGTTLFKDLIPGPKGLDTWGGNPPLNMTEFQSKVFFRTYSTNITFVSTASAASSSAMSVAIAPTARAFLHL